MNPDILPQRLAEAVARREPLRRDAGTTVFRLVNGEADGLTGITVDWFDGVASASFYRDLSPDEETALLDALEVNLHPGAIYLKRRPREARVVATTQKEALAPQLPIRGQPVASKTVLENEKRFLIRPGQGLAVGLYLDMRDPRAWLEAQVRGKTVLNCFAYTCAFAVYALAGGAARAVNVDLSRRVLDWGMENLAENGFAAQKQDFIAGDVFDWLRRFHRKGELFDVVVVDPPGFSTVKGKAFSAAQQYALLSEAAARVVAPGGTLVACCNVSSLSSRAFLAKVQEGVLAAGRAVRSELRLGPSPLDFPPAPSEAPALKVTALTLNA